MSVGVVLSCIVARIVVVFMFGGLLRVFARQERWTIRSLLFFSLCGIRGAISFALCSALDTRWATFAKSSIFVVIITTILFMGVFQRCLYLLLLAPVSPRVVDSAV
jgi:NhaP-type Na+/H+ or K+/H+ antiporter